MSEQNKALLSASPVFQHWSQITVLPQSRKVVLKPLTCRAVCRDQTLSSWFLPNFLVQLSALVDKIHRMHVFTSYFYALYVHNNVWKWEQLDSFLTKADFVFSIATTMRTCTGCFVLQEPLAGGHITCKNTWFLREKKTPQFLYM